MLSLFHQGACSMFLTFLWLPYPCQVPYFCFDNRYVWHVKGSETQFIRLCLPKTPSDLVLQEFLQAHVTMLHACLRKPPVNFDLDVADSQAPSQR